MAVQLIAAGGAYAHRQLADVVNDLMVEMQTLDDFFEGVPATDTGCGDPTCPDCGPIGGSGGGNGGESVH